MSFKGIIDYLDKTEAVTGYAPTKKENEELRNQVSGLKETLKKLQEKADEYDAYRIKYKKDYTPEEFDYLIEEKTREWKETQLENKVNEKWMREAPQLVEKRLGELLLKYPSKCPQKLIQIIVQEGKKQADWILYDRLNWPQQFEDFYRKEVEDLVQKRMNQEFHNNVEYQANIRLNQLIEAEWPTFLNQQAKPFLKKTLIDQIYQLTDNVQYTCHRCGENLNVNLYEEAFSQLLRVGYIKLPCNNPQCKGVINQSQTKFTFTDLLQQKVFNQQPPNDMKTFKMYSSGRKDK